jgi:serine/threonine-protein kinase RsbW
MNQERNENMEEIREIKIDEQNPLFNRKGLFYKEFPSDFRQIRYFTLLIVQKAPPEIREINLLEQQVSEILKNAIKHGNKCDINKKVRVWFSFDVTSARLVVEDEGAGFKDLEKWNEFHKERTRCFFQQDFERMEKYISFRTINSDDHDGGNALFAAVEYWDGGVIFNKKRNCIALLKTFPIKQRGMDISENGKEN